MLHYNSSEFIEEAIASIKNQKYNNWCLYVYDDGSDNYHLDRLCKALNGIEGKYVLIKGKHVYQYEGRLKLFEIIDGDIVINIDSDDKFTDTNFFSNLNKIFNLENPDMVFFNMTKDLREITGNVRINEYDKIKNRKQLLNQIRQDFCNCKVGLNSLCDKAFNRKVIKKSIVHHKSNLTFTEDRLHILYCLNYVKNIYIWDKVNYYYRIHKTSTLHQEYKLIFFENRIYIENEVERVSRKWKVIEHTWNNVVSKIFFQDMHMFINNNSSYKHKTDLFKKIWSEKHCKDFLNNINYCECKMFQKVLLYFFKWKAWWLYIAFWKAINFIIKYKMEI